MLQKRTNADAHSPCELEVIEPDNNECVQFFEDITLNGKESPLSASVGDEDTN